MRENKKSLQKFTDFENKMNSLFEQITIEETDIEGFTETEKDIFQEEIQKRFTGYQGNNKETMSFLDKVFAVVPQYIKNQTWEYNHLFISQAITDHIAETGMMPDKNIISNKTGLSRQTIHKHFKEYSLHPLHIEHKEKFKLMTTRVLSKVLQLALSGDMKAAKIYLSMLSENETLQQGNSTLIQNQNNYIQINGTVLSQEIIKQLSPEQLNQIENVLKGVNKLILLPQ